MGIFWGQKACVPQCGSPTRPKSIDANSKNVCTYKNYSLSISRTIQQQQPRRSLSSRLVVIAVRGSEPPKKLSLKIQLNMHGKISGDFERIIIHLRPIAQISLAFSNASLTISHALLLDETKIYSFRIPMKCDAYFYNGKELGPT